MVYYSNERIERTCLTCRHRYQKRDGGLRDCPARTTLAQARKIPTEQYREGCINHSFNGWIERAIKAPKQGYERCPNSVCDNNSGDGCVRGWTYFHNCSSRRSAMSELRRIL